MHSCKHEIALKQHYFCAVKIALHRNFLRITFNFASQNFDFASQTAMRYRINSSLNREFVPCGTNNYFPREKVPHQGICSPFEMCAYTVFRAQCTSALASSTPTYMYMYMIIPPVEGVAIFLVVKIPIL